MSVALTVVLFAQFLNPIEKSCVPIKSPDGRYVHWFSDYGMYCATDRPKPAPKVRYHRFFVSRIDKMGTQLAFSGKYSADLTKPLAPLTLTYHDGRFRARAIELFPLDDPPKRPAPLKPPVPSLALHRKYRPKQPVPGEMNNEIEAFEREGDRVWFGNSFYDAEGLSGVGALGTYHRKTRKFEFFYLPEIVNWSVSALRLVGPDVWVALAGRPEGAFYGGGVLRIHRETKSVRRYPIQGYISGIALFGQDLFFATDHGVYRLENLEKLWHITVEPSRQSPHAVAIREVVVR
jgi:hypothetical protein